VSGTSRERFLEGRAVLVTGGASGLGRAVALACAGRGAHAVVADLDAEGADRVATEIRARDGLATAIAADVRRTDQVEAMVDVAGQAAPLGGLVLSAAVETRSAALDCTDDDWQRVIDVNLKGPFLCMRAAIPQLKAAGGGSIVALGSTLGHIGSPGYAAYCASKGGLVNLCKQAAIEHAADQIRVNVVSPSATDAGLFAQVAATMPDPDSFKARIAAHVPMGRLGVAEDVSAAVLWLLSPASAYISGAVIPVDGALAARRM
jgi:NAD(P)-dependent dehydrogenase (short-subunit alcohol dehydrogenase family)